METRTCTQRFGPFAHTGQAAFRGRTFAESILRGVWRHEHIMTRIAVTCALGIIAAIILLIGGQTLPGTMY